MFIGSNVGQVGRVSSGSAAVGPALDLGFLGGVLDPRLTFTRPSVATYFDSTGTLQTVSNHVPRFDYDPVTLAARGLLIEEARTNYALQSGAMASVTYTPFRATMTANAAVVPDGSNSGARLTEDTSTNTHPLQANFAAIPVNAPVAASVYIKAAGRTNLQFIIYDNTTQANTASVNFDLSAGTAAGVVVAGAAVAGTSSIASVGNGWYRITLTATLSATATTGILYRIYPMVAGAVSYTGDGTSGLFLWGAQLEAGAFPTSLIPTTGVTVTRQNDVAQILQTFNAPLSWVYETRHANNVNIQIVGGVSNAAGFNDTAYNSVPAAGNNSVLNCRVGGVGLPAPPSVPFPLNADNKIGATVTNNLRQTVSNGTATVVSDSTATTLPTYTKMVLLGAPWSPSTNVYNGWIRRARVWTRELSAAELVTVTR